jgi:hypothetical protein
MFTFGCVLAQAQRVQKSEISFKGDTVTVEYVPQALGSVGLLENMRNGQVLLLAKEFTNVPYLAFGDVTIPAGTYSVWLFKRNPTLWKLVFNMRYGNAIPGREYPSDQTFRCVPLLTQGSGNPNDLLKMNLSVQGATAQLVVNWGDLSFSTNFRPNPYRSTPGDLESGASHPKPGECQ